MSVRRLATNRYVVVSASVLVLAAVTIAALLTIAGPKPTLAEYERMIDEGELIGLSLPEARSRIRYRWRNVDSDTAEFNIKHVNFFGWAWINVEVRDGVITEASLYQD